MNLASRQGACSWLKFAEWLLTCSLAATVAAVKQKLHSPALVPTFPSRGPFVGSRAVPEKTADSEVCGSSEVAVALFLETWLMLNSLHQIKFFRAVTTKNRIPFPSIVLRRRHRSQISPNLDE